MSYIESKKFDKLLNLIDPLKSDSFGEWIIDKEHNGTSDDTIHLAFPHYSDVVEELINAIYDFHKNNPEFQLNNYRAILEKHGIRWEMEEMIEADPSKMDEKVILAMLMGMVRAEHFSEGSIMKMLESGCVHKWLEQLKNICEGLIVNKQHDINFINKFQFIKEKTSNAISYLVDKCFDSKNN